jgi:hypothetical protein
MHKVQSIKDLKKEKKRLLARSEQLELEMKKDLHGLKEEIDQSHLFTKVVRKLVTGKEEGMYFGTGMLTDFLIKRIFFRKAGWVTQQTLSTLAQNAAHTMLEEKKDQITTWAENLWQKLKPKKENKHTHAHKHKTSHHSA